MTAGRKLGVHLSSAASRLRCVSVGCNPQGTAEYVAWVEICVCFGISTHTGLVRIFSNESCAATFGIMPRTYPGINMQSPINTHAASVERVRERSTADRSYTRRLVVVDGSSGDPAFSPPVDLVPGGVDDLSEQGPVLGPNSKG